MIVDTRVDPNEAPGDIIGRVYVSLLPFMGTDGEWARAGNILQLCKKFSRLRVI